jgi:hypothetical protein
MRDDIRRDWDWATRYDQRLQMITMQALRISRLASASDDMLRATDFQFLWQSDQPVFNIAGRVRRPSYDIRYPHDITFRYERVNGVRTEWQKIITDGFADFAVYAIAADEETDQVSRAAVINLHLFRQHVAHNGKGCRGIRENPDNMTSHIVWDLHELAYCTQCLGMVLHQQGHQAISPAYVTLMTSPRQCTVCGDPKAVAWGEPQMAWLCEEHRPGRHFIR